MWERMWERAADDADASGKSMFWDCIFIGELWENGDVMDPKAADMNEQEEAARLAFEQTMKAFNAVKELTNILLQQLQKGMRDPSSIDWEQFRQFAEERRQQAEVLARDLDTLRQKITNNLPGTDLFDLSRLPNPVDRLLPWQLWSRPLTGRRACADRNPARHEPVPSRSHLLSARAKGAGTDFFDLESCENSALQADIKSWFMTSVFPEAERL
ncbi:hypothetical protein [Mesorhizobium sp. M0522]|uniref:hypothetical protein n=1 Tax=Mesorhizobium sp. M0522 TaxID=2956958 RepID=UPI0033370C77